MDLKFDDVGDRVHKFQNHLLHEDFLFSSKISAFWGDECSF